MSDYQNVAEAEKPVVEDRPRDTMATKEEAAFIRAHADDVRLEKPDWSALPPPTAEEAARIIAPHWDSEPQGGAPEDQHKWLFLREVCRRLGREPNPINVGHAARLMDKMGIPLPSGHEYPKALYAPEPDELGRPVPVRYPPGHPKHGEEVVFANADEESAWGNEPHGEPVASPALGKVSDVDVEHDDTVAVHDRSVPRPAPANRPRP